MVWIGRFKVFFLNLMRLKNASNVECLATLIIIFEFRKTRYTSASQFSRASN